MSSASHPDFYAVACQEMLDSQLRRRGIQDPRVLDAMARMPRHEFVTDIYRAQAYDDHPIPIGEGQSISQPYIVAVTLQALALRPSDIVLEVGTGSGYQTALLAALVLHVYSVERHVDLARQAEGALLRLGYDNATVVAGDGSQGLPDRAPFDAIAVSAAAPFIPHSLLEQLTEGGRMVIPVGPEGVQELLLVRKQDEQPVIQTLGSCRFVPLVGARGYPSGW